MKCEGVRIKRRPSPYSDGGISLVPRGPLSVGSCVNLLVCGEDVGRWIWFTMLHINHGMLNSIFFPIKIIRARTSLVVQWFRHCDSAAGNMILHAMWPKNRKQNKAFSQRRLVNFICVHFKPKTSLTGQGFLQNSWSMKTSMVWVFTILFSQCPISSGNSWNFMMKCG